MAMSEGQVEGPDPLYAKLCGDKTRRLSREEIAARIAKFNETNDWSVFDDVPPSQHVDVMYPHVVRAPC